LAVCAWQGPWPYWHAHAARIDSKIAETTAGAENEAALAKHLREFHGGAAHCTEECLQGHWHFVYPHDAGNGESGSGPAKNRLATSAAAGIAVVSAEQAVACDLVSPLVESPSVPCGFVAAPGRNTATHFYDGFAPTLSTPLRFGVARR
jgi:hypothetical protein